MQQERALVSTSRAEGEGCNQRSGEASTRDSISQTAGSSDDSTTPGFQLFDDDGFFLDSTPLDPGPISPDDGAYRAERFGTSFPTIPVTLLPSTSALIGDPNATIAMAVWIPGLVLVAEALVTPPPTDAPATDPPTADPSVDEAIADCFMYLEMYPELLEIDPGLAALCDADVNAARSLISALLAELDLL